MHKLRITNIIPRENHNVTINFEPVSGEFPTYKAGQFLTLSFEFANREVRRSYSFSSSPDVDEPLSITVKRVENGEISRFYTIKFRRRYCGCIRSTRSVYL